MKKLIALIIVLFFVLIPASGHGKTGLWDFSLIFSDESAITFGWDATPDPCPSGQQCGYELELRHLEQDFVDKYVIRGLATTTVQATYKKSGHYKLFIRAWSSADMQAFNYSEWNDSTASGASSPTASSA